MAEIKPFRAWRYHANGGDIAKLTSPLFDVVSDDYRQQLYQNPLNSIHLSVPLDAEDLVGLKNKVERWKKEHIIVQDRMPAMYVYYQYFKLPGDEQQYCRKGFIAQVRLHEWEEHVILRHEDTMPHAVEGRKHILEYTQMHASPTHGLYSDENHSIEAYLDAAITHPLYDTEDYQGVRNVLGVIHDYHVIQKLMTLLKDKSVILADGHHRYQAALDYRRQRQATDTPDTGHEPYHFHTMYLTNMESDDLRIFPNHRLVRKVKDFKEADFLHALAHDFHIRSVENEEDLLEVIAGKKWAFGLMMGDHLFKIRLKQEKYREMAWQLPEIVKSLDVNILHHFVLEKALGIKKEQQAASNNIRFEKNLTRCLKKILTGEAQAALIVQAVSMQTVKEVCFSGYKLPQKTTHFYPKVICGYIFGSIEPEDHHALLDRCF